MSDVVGDTSSSSAPESAASILLVYDDPSVLQSLTLRLTSAGYQVTEVAGGKAALEALHTRPYSLLIVDYWMAGVSGKDVLQAAANEIPDVPRIMMTGSNEAETLIECINSGLATKVMHIPWNEQALLHAIKELITCHQAQTGYRQMFLELNEHVLLLRKLEADLAQVTAEGGYDPARGKSAQANQDLTALLAYTLDVMSGGHKQNRRVAQLSSSLAVAKGLPEDEIRQVETAALLKNITDIFGVDNTAAPGEEPGIPSELKPLLANEILGRIEGFDEIARLVSKLQSDPASEPGVGDSAATKLGAEIISVAETFDNQMFPDGVVSSVRPQSALRALEQAAGGPLSAELVQIFSKQVVPAYMNDEIGDLEVALGDLKPGMVIAREILNRQGVTILAADTELTEDLIRNLQEVARHNPMYRVIPIKPTSLPVAEGDGEPLIHTQIKIKPANVDIGKFGVAELPAAPPPKPKPVQKPLIVVIDDNPNVTSALRRELETSGYRVKTFINPVEGLNYIRANEDIYAVLTDYMMPGLRGSRLIDLIKEIKVHLPCIVITAHATQDTISTLAMSAKPYRVLAKPWDKQQLLDTLASLATDQT